MARPSTTTISCPVCGQPFSAILEQIIDVGSDPGAKERLLSGRINLITCPHCGYRGMVGTPLMYHDPAKKLAITYVPMELNLGTPEREKLVGDLTNAVMRSLPEEAPKGYLLQPQMALTLQSLVDQVLEADGITKEMLEAERHKADLINQLADANSEERERLLAENQELFDLGFLELLTAASQAASQSNDSRRALRLLNIRSHLLETTEAGQRLKAQQEAFEEVSQDLQALGEQITRQQFVDLIVDYAGNEPKLDALATIGRTLLDYTTFQELSNRIDNTDDNEQQALLTEARERLLEISALFEQQSRALLARAKDTLKILLQASDIQTAIRNNLNRIDDLFLQVLRATLEEADRAKRTEEANKLRQIRDEILQLIQASSPPEIQLINQLLSAETEDESLQLLQSHASEVNEQLLDIMGQLAEQLREGGHEPAAQRLDLLRAEAQTMLS